MQRSILKRSVVMICLGGGIGDVLLTVPFLSAVRRRHDSSTLLLLGPPRTNSLLLDAGLVDQAYSDDGEKARSLYIDDPGIPWLAEIETAYVLWPDPEKCLSMRLERAGVSTVVTLPAIATSAPDAGHASQQLLIAAGFLSPEQAFATSNYRLPVT